MQFVHMTGKTGPSGCDRDYNRRIGGTRITASGGREVIVLSARAASQTASQAAAQTDTAGFAAQSRETATQRIHVVTFQGETFTAATPLDGPWSRIVFDPARRLGAAARAPDRMAMTRRAGAFCRTAAARASTAAVFGCVVAAGCEQAYRPPPPATVSLWVSADAVEEADNRTVQVAVELDSPTVSDVIVPLMKMGASTLRQGRGALYVRAAGNGFEFCDRPHPLNREVGCIGSNTDPEQNLPWMLNVGAFNAEDVKSSYSGAGANLWVVGPGGEDGIEQPAIVTTDQAGAEAGFNLFQQNPLTSAHPLNRDGDYVSAFGVTLRSPSGTSSVVNPPFNSVLAGFPGLQNWQLLSNAFYGENPNGAWTVHVADLAAQDTGHLTGWRLRFYYGEHP